MLFSSILLGTGLAQLSLAAYNIKDDYSADNFASMFRFDTMDDPTHGYVNYVDQNTAQSSNLYQVQDGQVLIGVDSTNVASGRGRNSVRLTSNAAYTHGLVILDLAHMPGSACGSWPAFWMTGPNWPSSGEIDIIEGVNSQSENKMTMHTSEGCTLVENNCQGNLGCGATGGGSSSYGTGFNSAGGGIYATEWTSDSINIWFFSHGSAPSDINSANPNPSGWGNPTTSFVGGSGCDIDSHFMNNNIVFDTTFCGDWAGAVFSQDSTCSALGASSCQDYVQNHPEAFKESYWAVNSLKVYEQGDSTSTTISAQDVSSSSPISVVQSTPSPSPVSVTTSTSASPVISSIPVVSSVFTAPSFSASFTPVSSGQPINSANFTSTATSGFPINSANISFAQPTGGATSIAPTPVSPAEGSVAVVTQTVTGDFVVTHTHYPSHYPGRNYHHGHNGAILPEKRRISHRAARHLQQHVDGALS